MIEWLPQSLLELITHKNGWDNILSLDRIAGNVDKPRVQILHGDQDEVCPYHMGETLGEQVKRLDFPYSSSAFKRAEGVGHNNVFDAPVYLKWLKRALNATLD